MLKSILILALIVFSGRGIHAQTYISLIQRQIANDLLYYDSVEVAQDTLIASQRDLLSQQDVLISQQAEIISEQKNQVSILLQHQVNDAEQIHILRKEVRKKSRGSFLWKAAAIGFGLAFGAKSVGVF
jgi:adenine-specific DNA methylase